MYSGRLRDCLGAYDSSMDMLHITEAELARDVHGVLEKVAGGAEVLVEQDQGPVAIIKPSRPRGRMISDIIAHLDARGSHAVVDDDFARDIEEGILAHREPWNPPSPD
jgi:hypothetical protein